MYFLTVVACAALPFLVGAVPVSTKSARAGDLISMPLKHYPNHLNNNGQVDLQKMQASIRRDSARFDHALRAYGSEPHPLEKRESKPSNERRQDVTVNLNDTANMNWAAELTIGTPPITFSVGLDTLTATTFVSGVNCTTCLGHNLFNKSNSSTVFDENVNATVALGGGNITGDVVRDVVTMGGFEVKNQVVVVANEIDPALQIDNFLADGSLGMGFFDVSESSEPSLFTNFFTTGQLANGKPVIGINLDQSNPEIVIGGTDPEFANSLTVVNLTSMQFWAFNVDSLSVNGTNIFNNGSAQQGVLDIASNYISASASFISDIYANIPGSAPVANSTGNGTYTIPCDTNVTVTMTIGGTSFNISPKTYNLGPVAGSTDECMAAFAQTDNPSILLGATFMLNVYTEFHLDTPQLGFAPISVTGSSPGSE